ncbi:hypothetical protein Dsin_012601 [Dipteronia sinensis]|uniref:HAT C-terminal dimerisation domain-containing protein n=1 Tax=Dipteronia sinensis TaxID=43782 RepID=A0AAE0E868_9ROSI|nr:hypothetical protein Dsin_012601 [Dipteronia sinensis]
MASGGDDSSLRNLDRGKGPMQDLLEHEGDDVNYNDRICHEFLQREFGSDLSPNSSPPLIISEPNLNTPTSNENISTPSTMPPSSDDFYAGEEEKPLKSDLFKTHMKKTELDDGMIKIKCNYCPKTYKTSKNFGYGTYWAHIRKNHPSEMVKGSNQAQISRYGTPNNQLFHYTSEKNKEQLAVMVAVEHLPFSFGEKVGFVNYCQNALNPAMQRVRRVTLTRALFSIYKKEKHKLKSFFYQFEGRVSVCADIWTDNFGSHHYIGVHIVGAITIIAKQILGTPVSTVAVEQEFSAGGNILEPRRSVLCPQSLEAQACVDDWTKAKFRQQELEPEIVNDFFEDDQTTGTEGSE